VPSADTVAGEASINLASGHRDGSVVRAMRGAGALVEKVPRKARTVVDPATICTG
jgi:hypothetical protein